MVPQRTRLENSMLCRASLPQARNAIIFEQQVGKLLNSISDMNYILFTVKLRTLAYSTKKPQVDYSMWKYP